MTRLVRRCLMFVTVLAAATLDARAVSAQVSIPNIQNPINKAKAAAGKTSDQINATNKIGNEKGASDAPGAAAAAQMADQQKKAAASQSKVATPAPQKGAKAGAKPDADTGVSVQLGGSRRGQVTIYREAFSYQSGGRRDPFVSLMLSGELRPILSDLVLTGVIYDSDARRSVAILVDASTGEVYRVRAGQTLARMKVTRIGEQDVSFNIDEFGLSRSETLIIDKTRKGAIAAPRRP